MRVLEQLPSLSLSLSLYSWLIMWVRADCIEGDETNFITKRTFIKTKTKKKKSQLSGSIRFSQSSLSPTVSEFLHESKIKAFPRQFSTRESFHFHEKQTEFQAFLLFRLHCNNPHLTISQHPISLRAHIKATLVRAEGPSQTQPHKLHHTSPPLAQLRDWPRAHSQVLQLVPERVQTLTPSRALF